MVALLVRVNKPLFTLDMTTQQRRDVIHLYSHCLNGSVVLINTYNWLEIYYTGLPGIGCSKVLQAIKDVLPKCARTLYYDDSVTQVIPTFPCQNQHDKSVALHPAELTLEGRILVATCTEDKTLPPVKLTDERYLAWFETPSG